MHAMRLIMLGFMLWLPQSHAASNAEQALLRDRALEDRPALLVLGTPHFNNPGRDVVNPKVPDVLDPQRQRELDELTRRLSLFGITAIAVEWPKHRQQELDQRYEAYKEGTYKLGRSEVDQIGLRVAATLGLDRVWAVDWNGMPPGELRTYDWATWADQAGQQSLLTAIRTRPDGPSDLAMKDVVSWLIEVNSPATLTAAHRVYFDYLQLGDDNLQAGSNWVGHWYTRNLRIFRNLLPIANHRGERVLVVYGSGHAYLLKQFATESGAFSLIEPSDLLRETD